VPDILDTVLLLALPASGKSEVRKYMASLDVEACARDFKMGPTVQLDDFPYVHIMRLADEALLAAGKPRVFFEASDKSFMDRRDWGTLIHLVNEDYADLRAKRPVQARGAAAWLLGRIDEARAAVGAPRFFDNLDAATQGTVCDAVEKDARALLDDKLANYPDTLEGKTLVIEFARGGPDGATPPLPAPHGYAYSLAQLSSDILSRAGILYVWVTPEESRRKNEARADPNDPGSILHHGVPIDVMLGEYGCDDMAYLIETSGKKGHVQVKAHGKTFDLPVARFDNRQDKTSFVRDDAASWKSADVKALHDGLAGALTELQASMRS
jgi:hypothetical protein